MNFKTTYIVTHHFKNPHNNMIEYYSKRKDAVAAGLMMSSTDPSDGQYTEIENTITHETGKRTWGRRRIQWTKAILPMEKALSDALPDEDGKPLGPTITPPGIDSWTQSSVIREQEIRNGSFVSAARSSEDPCLSK